MTRDRDVEHHPSPVAGPRFASFEIDLNIAKVEKDAVYGMDRFVDGLLGYEQATILQKRSPIADPLRGRGDQVDKLVGQRLGRLDIDSEAGDIRCPRDGRDGNRMVVSERTHNSGGPNRCPGRCLGDGGAGTVKPLEERACDDTRSSASSSHSDGGVKKRLSLRGRQRLLVALGNEPISEMDARLRQRADQGGKRIDAHFRFAHHNCLRREWLEFYAIARTTR